MSAQMCTLLPASPLPLDQASAEGAYELIKENSLPAAVKELLDSVDSLVARQLALQQGKQSTCFCSYHSDLISLSENPKEVEDMWVLQRDISVQLFKIMMGVVRSAADLARRLRSLGQRSAQVEIANALDDLDLELAFTGDARGGYQWLNCLAKDECGWVWTAINDESLSLESHCPACLLGRAIDSESTIRLLITAARLVKWDFFVTSIQEHLECDPWWGPGYWETIEPKANVLGTQIRDLLEQCADIRQRLKLTASRQPGQGDLVRSSVASTRRTASYGPLSKQFHSIHPASIPMKLDLRQLHRLVDMLSQDGARDEHHLISGALRPYNHARMANNYRLAAYCWFVLMYNMSLPPSSEDSVLLQYPRTNRSKSRSKTV
ncbi:hypothetical protein H072_399 [Dactylellina haptotyla CBS 200.50]|uniref:Uncharacterized protein n=1 Tax=Dactylellina haptotyla (strain CBS 200.50) TaxID=1284197 RepID=S8ARV7_DACHA|nr:hypothetical protein H072_399 [Dactylellina haptotyla CBS 200.50]